MWNKGWVIFLVAGLVSFVEVFPQDSVMLVPEEMTGDTLQVAPPIKAIYPVSLSQFQRDSIIGIVPQDTSAWTVTRHFNGYFVEKYASDGELDYERNINKSFFQRLKEMLRALLNKLLGMPDVSKINNLSEKILNFLLGVIFLVAVYIAVRLFMNHRGRWFFEKKNETVSVDFSNVEKHIHEADFSALLSEAEQNGDTRQSVRLLYLWVLKTFADDHIIRWNADKTNIDYLSEIQDKVLQEEFRYLSYLYNYIWYGEFSINDSEYRNARETFFRHIKIKPENE